MSRLITIDAERLLDLPLKKPEFLVDGLLPRGLTVLAGASKSGKSWLVLLLSLCISRGEPLWDMPTHRCGVLYISLEDTLSRLQSRVYRLTDEADANLRFCVSCGKLGVGLEEQLNGELSEHPETGLVIIDTLQLIRDNTKDAKTGMYAADYEAMFALKRIADDNGIGILVVHHVRKLKDKDDPFNEMSGSTAIGGGADTAICLRKSRSSKLATLYVTGRDLDYQELTIEQVDCAWELRERKDALQIQQEAVPQYLLRIPDFMRDKQVWRGSASELLATLGETEISPRAVRKHLVDFSLEVLFRAGIEYSTHRTANSRMIILRRSSMDDEGDENDDPVQTGSHDATVMVPAHDTTSFPSLSSFCVCERRTDYEPV